jgi:hypothetical protein
MPEGRFVSRTIAHSEQLAAVSLEADYLFARCIPHLDVEGRLSGNPALVKAIAVPLRKELTEERIAELLAELDAAELVVWYAVGGKQVLAFPGFGRHQKLTKSREAESRFPALTPDAVRMRSGVTPESVRSGSGASHPEVEVEVEVEVQENHQHGARASRSAPWMAAIREIHVARYESPPPKQLVKALRPLVEKHGIEEVAHRYANYVANTAGEHYNAWKLGSTWADWGNGVPRGPPRKLSAGEQQYLNATIAMENISRD